MRIDQSIILTFVRVMRGVRRRIRTIYYSRVLQSMGRECQICDHVLITGPENVSLGNRVSVNDGVIIQSCEGANIAVGDDVTLSYNAKLITGGLFIDSDGALRGQHLTKSIILEDSVWVGAGAIILPGVKVRANAIVAAGSVVSHNVEANTIVGGAPAKTIRVLQRKDK